jgi:hypothetical protein
VTRHLLVIGAQRCGTTYLHDLLAAHPEVAMARPARPEPKVFLSEDLSARGAQWYRASYFAHARGERLLGEKSTSYLEHAQAADRALAVLGDPLVLVQLRDPVQRAVSHWAFSTQSGLETRSLTDALAANLEGPLPWDPAATSVSPYAYLERGRYTHYLRPWRDRLGDDLAVLLLEEQLADTGRLAAVYAWLGVDADFRPEGLGKPVNVSSHPTAALDPALEEALRGYFAESDAALESLLGRPLPWSRATRKERTP